LQKGDNQQNISFTGEARRWHSCTYYKCFEVGYPAPILVIFEDKVITLLTHHRGALTELFVTHKSN